MNEQQLDQALTNLPDTSKFVSHNYDVLMHGNIIATARSKTMATRIANALNMYIPNANGR